MKPWNLKPYTIVRHELPFVPPMFVYRVEGPGTLPTPWSSEQRAINDAERAAYRLTVYYILVVQKIIST